MKKLFSLFLSVVLVLSNSAALAGVIGPPVNQANVAITGGTITGATVTATTNANLTGVITSVGNATSIASQTGTGTKFVTDTSPTLVTPILGIAAATSINFGGSTLSNYVSATSWTPTDASGASLTFTSVVANYTRTGNMVHAYFSLTYPVTADGSAALIGGLPITVPNTNYARQGVVSYATLSTLRYAIPTANTTNVGLYTSAGSAVTNASMSGQVIIAEIIYPVQ